MSHKLTNYRPDYRKTIKIKVLSHYPDLSPRLSFVYWARFGLLLFLMRVRRF